MTDMYIDELFEYVKASEIIFPISRLIVDPERFLNDSKEYNMAKIGMGVIYTSE